MKIFCAAVFSVTIALWVTGCKDNSNDVTSPCASGSSSCPLAGEPQPTPPATPAPGAIVTQNSFSPSDGTQGVPTSGTTISVAVQGGADSTTFSYDAGSLDNISLTDSAGRKIPIQVLPSSSGFQIKTQGCNLYPDTTYTVSVSGISNMASPQQSLAGTVTSTFKTNSSYVGPACEDAKLSWTAPTSNTNGTPLAMSAITNYVVYAGSGPCQSGSPLDQDSSAKSYNVPATGQGTQDFVVSQDFPPAVNGRFAVKACTGGGCSVLSNEACKIVAPPN